MVELCWKFEKYIYGNKFLRPDILLSKSCEEQRNAQFQFILRARHLIQTDAMKKGVFPPDTWRSGRQQNVKASSDHDTDMIKTFHKWLGVNNLSKKSNLEDVSNLVWNKIGRFTSESEGTWVTQISENDIKKLKGGYALCKSAFKKAAYGDFKKFMLSEL
eukprot:259617_1